MATKDLGQVAVRPRGSWDNATEYTPRDFVYNPTDGCGYVAKVTNTNIRPDTDSTKWDLAVSKGLSGASAALQKVTHTSSETVVPGLSWDAMHVFPEMASLAFTLASAPSDGYEHQMVIIFDTPADMTDFTLTADSSILWANGLVLADVVAASKRYEVNINSSSLIAVFVEATIPSI